MGQRVFSKGWLAQPAQKKLLKSDVFEVVYGGARGGGKTDATLADFVTHQKVWGKPAKGLFLRRQQSDLSATIGRARELYRLADASYRAQDQSFVFPSGATIRFSYLSSDEDAERYQGHDFTRIYVEELTQFPDPRPVDRLKATLRSAAGVTCGFRASCNPGGPGHHWVKQRYIDPAPPETLIEERYQNPFTGETQVLKRVFIPAKLTDNPALMNADPLYVAKLQQSGSPALVRAWLEGDWNVVEGAFFDGWSGKNVLKRRPLPRHWVRFRSFDWGSARPFSVGWWAIAGEDLETEEGLVPRGALVRYREAEGLPEEGFPAGTRWADIPDTWSCPDCGMSKSQFEMVEL